MQPSSPLEYFVITALAVWRITHLLVGEDGPGRIFARLRETAAAGGGVLLRSAAAVLGCFYCASIWVAGVLCWVLEANGTLQRVLLWLGLSGAACLLERHEQQRTAAPPNFYEGTEEKRHELLRKSARGHEHHTSHDA